MKSILQSKIVDESKVLKYVMEQTGLSQFDIEAKYKVNHPSDFLSDIGFVLDERPKGTKLPEGVIVSDRQKRIGLVPYACKSSEGQIGGKIVLKKTNGTEEMILKKDKIDGTDCVIDN